MSSRTKNLTLSYNNQPRTNQARFSCSQAPSVNNGSAPEHTQRTQRTKHITINISQVPSSPGSLSTYERTTLQLLSTTPHPSNTVQRQLVNGKCTSRIISSIVIELVQIHLVSSRTCTRSTIQCYASQLVKCEKTIVRLGHGNISHRLTRHIYSRTRSRNIFTRTT